MKQTAVDYLIEQLQAPCRGIPSHIIERAKEIEKEQIKEIALDQVTSHPRFRKIFDEQFEQYYKEKYGK